MATIQEAAARRQRRWAAVFRVLAVAVAVVAALVSAALVVLGSDDWAFGQRNLTSIERFVFGYMGLIVLTVAGIVWLGLVGFSIRKRHLRTRWLWAAPMVLIVGAMAFVALHSRGFDGSRDELDEVVAVVREHPAGWGERYGQGQSGPREIGDLDIEGIGRRDNGVIIFHDADGCSLAPSACGLVYSPNGSPSFPGHRGDVRLEHLDGPWYSFFYGL